MADQLQPDLRYSQNFLTSPRLIDHLLDRSSIASEDLVLEIGAGRGLITERLARRCRRVIAIEKDARLSSILRKRLGGYPNVSIHEADFLACRLPAGNYKVFASIPFSMTTQIVTKLTGAPNPPLDAYLVMQREAGARFTGTPVGSLWATLLKPWFELTVVHRFHRTDFDPVPQVDVVMLRLRKRGPPLIDNRAASLYRDFVTYCFTAWRRYLRDTLQDLFDRRRARTIADASGIRPGDTPSRLNFEQWLALFAAFKDSESRAAMGRVANAERRLRGQQSGLKKIHRSRTSGAVMLSRRHLHQDSVSHRR